jgi:hypothetical protein
VIQQTTAPTSRITCNAIGRAKLLAEITPDGISVWCRICHTSHVIPREQVVAAWEKGESVQCEVAQDEQRV